MRIISILKRVLTIAGKEVVPMIATTSPVLSGLLEVVVQSVFNAEATLGPKRGEEKMVNVLSVMEMVAPMSIKMIETTTGKDLVDDELFTRGIKKLVEAVVDILNSFRVLPKES